MRLGTATGDDIKDDPFAGNIHGFRVRCPIHDQSTSNQLNPDLNSKTPTLARYLRFYRKHLGRRLYYTLPLTAAAGLAEGFGIIMFLPLISALDSQTGVGKLAEPKGLVTKLTELFPSSGSEGAVTVALSVITAAFLFKALMIFCANCAQSYLRGELLRRLKTSALDSFTRISYASYSEKNTGYFSSLINQQVTRAVQSFQNFIGLATQITTASLYLGLAILLAWRLGAVAAIGITLMLPFFAAMNRKVRNLSRETTEETAHLSQLTLQVIQAFRYLTATNQFGPLKTGINNSINRLASHQFRAGMASGVVMAVTEPVAVIMIMIIVAVQVIHLKEPLAPILVSIFLFNRALNAAIGIQRVWQSLLEQSGSIELLDRELSLPSSSPDPSQNENIGPFAKAIELKGVCFSYSEAAPDVLKDMTLRIPSFTSVAIVGESGSGKSTLVDLIALIHKPRKGLIFIDDIPGNRILPASWRKQIGYVSQDSVIFDDTVANNICLWAGDFSEDRNLKDRIVEAARKAHIDHVIESLPEGYATKIGDRGLRLSAGQRQRLSIARELFRSPRLLILDEATSALDSESEHAIQKSIDELHGKITTIIIAHRFSTIQNVDQILVLDDGRIVEQGKFDDLKFAPDGKFGRLLSRQLLG